MLRTTSVNFELPKTGPTS